MRVRVFVLAASICAIGGASWAVGLYAHRSIANWVQFRVVQLTPPPQGLFCPGLCPVGHVPLDLAPIGIDRQGNILIADADVVGPTVARFDPRTGKWLPGVVETLRAGMIAPAQDGAWELGGSGGQEWVSQNWFGTWKQNLRIRTVVQQSPAGWSQVNAIAVNRKGTVWIAGWRSSGSTANATPCPMAAPAEPECTAAGWAAVGRVSSSGRRATVTRVPVGGPLTEVSAGTGGRVWALDPFGVCAFRLCHYPALVLLSPGRHGRTHLRVFPIPPFAQPPASATLSLAAGRGNTVWLVWTTSGPRVRVIRLADGRFTSRDLALGLTSITPVVDRQGNLWFCRGSGRPVMVKAASERVMVLPDEGGTTLSDQHGRIWYVMPPNGDTSPAC